MNRHLFTIGYATKPLPEFIAQLQRYQISAVADVRSVPYSKVFADYHQERIQAALQRQGIRYVYLGDELGPRSPNPEHYCESGQVQFDRLMQSAPFLEGVERLRNGLHKGFNIALMCAEKDPAECHRSLLIACYLQSQPGWQISHIRHDGSLESHVELEQRLQQLHGLGKDLFASADEQRQQAYRLQWQKTSYRRPPSD